MILSYIKNFLSSRDPEVLKRYETSATEQLYFPNSTFVKVERGKVYTWNYTYNLIEGNEKSSYAAVVLFNENKIRSGYRPKLFKENNDAVSSDSITFITPLETMYAQCVFVINTKDVAERSRTIIELPSIKSAEILPTTSAEERYDDLFDYHTKYAGVDLEEEPWLAIGSEKEHIGKIKEFESKLQLLKVRYGWTPDSTLLDIGCGTGGLANEIQKFTNSNENYVGVELVQKGVDYCKKHYPQFTFYKGEMTSVPHLDRKFDFICLYNVIIHMHPDDTVKLLQDARQYLANGGKFLITATINNNIPSYVGHKGRVEMTDTFFEDLMKKAGFSQIEKCFKEKEEGQMPFIVQ